MAENGKTVFGLGEIIWDCLPDGKQLGGAPANFVWHCARLGLHADVVSAVGADEPGDEALRRLQSGGLPCATVRRDPVHPTGRVDVTLDAEGKASYEFLADTAWDHPVWSDATGSALAHADAVCFGTLARRTPDADRFILRCLAAVPAAALRVFDINLRQEFYTLENIRTGLEQANLLKLNDEELPQLAQMFGLTRSLSAEAQLRELLHRFSLRGVALTCGAEGAVLIEADRITRAKAKPVKVQDTVGAGDSFTAVLTFGLLQGWPAQQVLNAAVAYAALVCSVAGGMPTFSAQDLGGILAPADHP